MGIPRRAPLINREGSAYWGARGRPYTAVPTAALRVALVNVLGRGEMFWKGERKSLITGYYFNSNFWKYRIQESPANI